ncbi:MAG: Phosphatidyl-N-methylethanolamine N-methyltransferase [Cyphobasidiales sp. Tagirdzhanova-0007]|nr:MAG: Phosphatidyl-N-methylethanolamine N-methyltransferase [Cyphobasidiales sp. Tagirdzhanova-0007]
MTAISDLVDLSQPSLWIATFSILFNPIYWNTLARSEYRSKTLTKLAGGNARLGCYCLAFSIFSLGLLRDQLYSLALEKQPKLAVLHYGAFKAVAALSFITGSTLVVSSMWKLGVTGTYLGDYFGILMDDRVTSFPFDVCDNPMYDGSTLCFLATALYKERAAGILLSILVFIEYRIALLFEEPFTHAIYAKRDQALKKRGTGGSPSKAAAPRKGH